jgi:hypothetical protein
MRLDGGARELLRLCQAGPVMRLKLFGCRCGGRNGARSALSSPLRLGSFMLKLSAYRCRLLAAMLLATKIAARHEGSRLHYSQCTNPDT